jgi:flagellar biosynthesis protein FlhG
MPDQADKLRLLTLKGKAPLEQAEALPKARPSAKSLAVVSGKGGVGKTSVATNLAIAFARRGRKVLLVDGDFSLANVDLLFGVVPAKNLGDVVLGGVAIQDVVVETEDGVRLLPAASGVEELADLDDFRRERLLRELSVLETDRDLIVLDTGSGISRQSMHLARAADQILVVTTPEPTAFSDAYATLKVLSRHRLRSRPALVVNMAGSPEEGREIERRIRVVAERFLGFSPEYLGHVLLDDAVGRAVRLQEPLLKAFPGSPASACIENLAARLLQGPGSDDPLEAEPDGESGFFQKVANLDA